MSNALARDSQGEEAFREAAVRATLEEIHRLAEQSGLLALNAALESIGARAAGGPAAEMDGIATQAGGAAVEAGRVAAAVEALLQQIQAGSAFARHCGRP
jgi:hypothetical protein